MIVELLVAVIAVVVIYELFEHVILPLVVARAHRGRAGLTGPEGLIGRVAVVRRWSGRGGTVQVNGELWSAECRTRLVPGTTATVAEVRNLTLVLAEPPGDQSSAPDGPPRQLAPPPEARAPSSTQRR
jgi:membrane-bound ClpP family serine protease